MNDLISVIIPVYNVAFYIERCINSLLEQTYKNIEILLIDDGSEDESGKICDQYAEVDNRIKVIHKNNSGQADSRNLGIDMSNGQYLAFIDADDFVTKDYIQYLYNLIKKYDADISNCEYKKIWRYEQADEADRKTLVERAFSPEAAIENLCYLKELNCAPYCKLFKKSVFQGVRFPVGYIYEDLAVVYRLFHNAKVISYGSKTNYFYFQRKGSSMNSEFNIKKLSRVKFSDEIEAFININYPNIRNAGLCRKFWSNAGALMDLPWRKENYKYLECIRKNIYQCRSTVISDTNAKFNIRIMAGCSFLGMPILKILGMLYKKVVK